MHCFMSEGVEVREELHVQFCKCAINVQGLCVIVPGPLVGLAELVHDERERAELRPPYETRLGRRAEVAPDVVPPEEDAGHGGREPGRNHGGEAVGGVEGGVVVASPHERARRVAEGAAHQHRAVPGEVLVHVLQHCLAVQGGVAVAHIRQAGAVGELRARLEPAALPVVRLEGAPSPPPRKVELLVPPLHRLGVGEVHAAALALPPLDNLRAAGGGGLDQRSHFLRWAEGLGGPGLDAVHVHHVAAVDEGCYPEAHVETECRHARKHCVRLRELLLVQSQIVVPGLPGAVYEEHGGWEAVCARLLHVRQHFRAVLVHVAPLPWRQHPLGRHPRPPCQAGVF
mmetsp:Transcript_50438/g.93956  ORF Transcript_50438/g.93956 Transcript_50438/m.93956 type:complete len:342 (-) Transcript_50438:1248-2273(-)